MRSGEQHNRESSVGGGSLSRVTLAPGVHPTRMHTGEQHSLPMLRVLSRVLILAGTFSLNAPAGTGNNKKSCGKPLSRVLLVRTGTFGRMDPGHTRTRQGEIAFPCIYL